ncbi:MAG TPA: tetratricopeptide repeat protein [Planctomycetaceae bacterium]|nr:tetratricopeptide repeat protein [Planctomycetaceae bacterium]
MSHSPISSGDRDQEYRDGWEAILDLVNTGGSWSGHERNRCFLNTGGVRFADVSATSGLDFLDDSRCVASIDWDMDGDLDLWFAARTGPRLRFVRNDTRDQDRMDKHFLAVKLIGKSSNRDAIGAQVRLQVGDHVLVRTVRAGNGYLTQSSKWVHFGLAHATSFDQLSVRWPGGGVEVFEGASVDARFELTQGSGTTDLWKSADRKVLLASSITPTQNDTPPHRVVLLDRVPMPKLDFVDLDNTPQTLPGEGRGPVLISLWAAWCAPCHVELMEIKKHEARLREANLRIVALSVDGLLGDASDLSKAKAMANKLQFPFEMAVANPNLLETLDTFSKVLISLRSRTTVLPSSYLLDEFGRLTVIYPGPLGVEQLLSDVAMIQSRPTDEVAFPFPGRWLEKPRQMGALLTEIANEFQARKSFPNATLFAGLAEDLATRDSIAPEQVASLSEIFYQAGTDSVGKESWERARQQFEACVRLRPDWPEAHSNLGVVFRQLGQSDQAWQHLQIARELSPGLIQPHLILGIIRLEQGEPLDATAYFHAALRLKPDFPVTLNYMGVAYARLGQRQQAISHLQLATQYGSAEAEKNLQSVLDGKTP